MAALHRLKSISSTSKQICLFFFVLGLLVCLPSLLYRRHVPSDTAHYYAPMIGPFSEGLLPG